MAQPSVKTVQFIDPRIEPQPDPVYDYVIGPTQNQYYKIGASSVSNSSIFFNNLTTLGTDRAYLDTMEIECSATIRFKTNMVLSSSSQYSQLCPKPEHWTFDSFPLNKCCESARVNINGGAFFSQPLSYVRAKERYMDQQALAASYENVCPTHAPVAQYESTRTYHEVYGANAYALEKLTDHHNPSRLSLNRLTYMQSQVNMTGGCNNDIIQLGAPIAFHTRTDSNNSTYYEWGYENYKMEVPTAGGNYVCVVKVTWREPLFCSPFSSRYDATYGRPLYNITSIDINLNLQNLGNMIRIVNPSESIQGTNPTSGGARPAAINVGVETYDINIDSAMLCYQVCTIPTTVTRPLSTLTPYRRFVPYITEIKDDIPVTGGNQKNIASGVYTLNEIPTAIWMFVAPVLSRYQTNEADKTPLPGALNPGMTSNNYDSNKLFAYIYHTSITMANTTQLLNQAEPRDLYRIAKANGCQDSYMSWAGQNILDQYSTSANHVAQTGTSGDYQVVNPNFLGAGSVLRLIPGVDLVVPDQPLIPGANANNMVFQAYVDAIIPPRTASQQKYALWLLFEYVGVASISPGQCEISMNPLGSGEIMSVSPVVSATSMATEGKLEGSGAVWDWIKKLFRIGMKTANQKKLFSRGLRYVADKVEDGKGKKVLGIAGDVADKLGYGSPAKKARGLSGGAVMGLGDWT